jgi:hypothetical protein
VPGELQQLWVRLLLSAGVSAGAELALASRAQAQTAAPNLSSASTAAPAAVILPQALGPMEVDYPADAEGTASVELQLLVNATGQVDEAVSVNGAEPFVSAAIAAAKNFKFSPAQRWDNAQQRYVAVAARVTLSIHFAPPKDPEPITTDAAHNAEMDAKPTAAAPAPSAEESPTAAPPPTVNIEVRAVRQRPSAQLSRAEVRELPGAFGDPFRAIEALPGVTPVASGLPYFYVRGAPPGNLGYFFDGISVPSLYHVAVGPGVIAPPFIESVELYSGAAPARYGRFAGAVIAGTSARPEYRSRAEATVRLVDAGGVVEAPFAEGRGSLMLGGRYSYTAALVSLLVPDVSIGYWDYQARAVYDLDARQKVTLFGFGAYDFLTAVNEVGARQRIYDVMFHRLDARYERSVGADTRLLFAVGAGLDSTRAGDDDGDRTAGLHLRQVNARSVLEHRLSRHLQLRSGVEVIVSDLNVELDTLNDADEEREEIERDAQGNNLGILPRTGVPDTRTEVLFDVRQIRRELELRRQFSTRNDLLTALWLDLPLQVTPEVSLTPGLRLDVYKTGPDTALAPEPRIDVRYQVTPKIALKHDLGIAHQPPSFVAPVPGLMGNVSQGLQQSVQSSAGIEARVPWDLTASVTLFQTALFNGSDALGLFQLQRSDPNTDASIERVTGHSYGTELYLRRPLTRRWGGFVSYTWSRTTRTSGRLSGPSSFDRRHVVNVALANDLGHGMRAGGRLAFYTGAPTEVAYVEAAQSPPRTPSYFRLDLRLEKRWLIGHEGAWWTLVLEVLNSTLNKEVLNVSCYAYGCKEEAIGPVTIPSLGAEAAF